MNGLHCGNRVGREGHSLIQLTMLRQAPAGDAHAPCPGLGEIVLGRHLNAQLRVRSCERDVPKHLAGRGCEIEGESQCEGIVEAPRARECTLYHCSCGFAIAGERKRERTEIARATAGIMVAEARRHRLMCAAVVQHQSGVRVGARLRELAAHQRRRPHRMMRLDLKAAVVELVRQRKQPRTQPPPLGCFAARAEHPLAPDRRKEIRTLTQPIAQRLRSVSRNRALPVRRNLASR